MDIRTEKKEILANIGNQISSFDNKASIMISIVGIMFALTIDLYKIFGGEKFISIDNVCLKVISYIMISIYSLSFLLCILFFVLVIVPRKNKTNKIHANYYGDVIKINEDDFSVQINNYCKDDKLIDSQIIINSKICNIKHIYLKHGIFSMIPFVASMVYFLILIICGF